MKVELEEGETLSEWIGKQVPEELAYDLPQFLDVDRERWFEAGVSPQLWLYYLLMQTCGQLAIAMVCIDSKSAEDLKNHCTQWFERLLKEQIDIETLLEIDEAERMNPGGNGN